MSRAGTSDGVLTDCALRLEAPLNRELLDRVRPPLPSGRLPDLEWLGEVNGDRAAALERFVTGWYPLADAAGSPVSASPPSGSASRLPGGPRQLYRLTETLRLVPLRPFWRGAPTRFYVAPGLVVHVTSEDGEAFDAWAGAAHRSALAPPADLPVDWNRFDG
ncbi:hypothetical protein GCM10017667_11640 [Streptomyces filamentosus]|uniref:Uncharacterized protein n=1 Tax=Streptomyces filamentosus TaxID=67294 RepID=A0A919BFE6_STRFL|nr:hypothetical protein GCM10017667_11640 [Streptomyces filamentosus]